MKLRGWQGYHTVWLALFLGWMISYIDRALTGPVITWMIENKVSFMKDIQHPHAFGGLLGSLFFAGYMLTQFPGGYFGDKYGHRIVVLISVFWAGVTTLLTGLIGGLFWFVALRVLTGLGEGAFYSNDRTIIARVTPPEKMGLGMGLVISGLSLGLALAILMVPPLIKWAQPHFGEESWRVPYLLMSIPTFLVVYVMSRSLRSVARSDEKLWVTIGALMRYSLVFFVAIMAVYFLARETGISLSGTGMVLASFAVFLLIYIYFTKKDEIRPVLFNRNLLLIYISAIPILWHLWLYSFWGVDIIKTTTGGSFMGAAVVTSFSAVAGLIGFPLGGFLSDRAVRSGKSRKQVLLLLTVIEAVSILAFGAYVMMGEKNVYVISVLFFTSGLFFFAQQSVAHAFTAELADVAHRGAAFGLFNLIAEIGAVLSLVISGTVRDHYHGWGQAIMLDGVLMTVSCILILAITVRPISLKTNS